MQQSRLFSLMRKKLSSLLNQYIKTRELMEDIDNYVVPAGLGNRSGVLGALVLAEEAANQQQ
jgi:fructokinase